MFFINADDTNSFYKLFGQSAHRTPVSMRLKPDGKHNNSQVLNITYGRFMPHLWINQPDPKLNKLIFFRKGHYAYCLKLRQRLLVVLTFGYLYYATTIIKRQNN